MKKPVTVFLAILLILTTLPISLKGQTSGKDIKAEKNIKADEEYGVKIEIEGQGKTNPVSDEVHWYDADENVSIKGNPDTGWTTVKWIVDGGDNENYTDTYNITYISNDYKITVVFEMINITARNPTPEDDAEYVNTYPYGAKRTIRELSVYIDHPYDKILTNVSFYDCTSDTPNLITSFENKTSGRRFEVDNNIPRKPETQYKWRVEAEDRDGNHLTTPCFTFTTAPLIDLTVNIEGNGTTIPPRGTTENINGGPQNIVAQSNESWSFIEWKGDIQSEKKSPSVFLVEDSEITVVFKPTLEITEPEPQTSGRDIEVVFKNRAHDYTHVEVRIRKMVDEEWKEWGDWGKWINLGDREAWMFYDNEDGIYQVEVRVMDNENVIESERATTKFEKVDFYEELPIWTVLVILIMMATAVAFTRLAMIKKG